MHELHNDLSFLPKKKKIEKVKKFVTNLHDKTKYVLHMRNLKQAFNHGLVLKKIYRVIKFNQKARLNPYTKSINIKAKNNFEKDFFKLMNVFF